jgi:hypothetical protein
MTTRQTMYVQRNIKARSRNHCRRGKGIIMCVCVSAALGIQHSKRMRRIILSSVGCLAIPYFSTLRHKRLAFRERVLNFKVAFWLSLQLLSEKFLILSRIQRDKITKVQIWKASHKVPLFLSDFNEPRIFSTDFWIGFRHRISWKSVHWKPSCPMRTDGEIHMTKLTVACRVCDREL